MSPSRHYSTTIRDKSLEYFSSHFGARGLGNHSEPIHQHPFILPLLVYETRVRVRKTQGPSRDNPKNIYYIIGVPSQTDCHDMTIHQKHPCHPSYHARPDRVSLIAPARSYEEVRGAAWSILDRGWTFLQIAGQNSTSNRARNSDPNSQIPTGHTYAIFRLSLGHMTCASIYACTSWSLVVGSKISLQSWNRRSCTRTTTSII